MWRNESKGDAVQVLFDYYFPFNGLLAGFLANNRFLILHGTSLRVEIHGSQWLDKNFNPVNVSRDVSRLENTMNSHYFTALESNHKDWKRERERKKGNRTLKFEEEFSMLSATRHHSHDSAKRSFIYYYSKDAQDESLKRNAEQVEEARLYLSSFEKRKLKERFGETIFDYTHLLTISLDFVEIDLYPSKEREELLFDDYSSPSSPLFFFSRVPWPQSRSNLYTDDCQKQGKHGTRGSRLN